MYKIIVLALIMVMAVLGIKNHVLANEPVQSVFESVFESTMDIKAEIQIDTEDVSMSQRQVLNLALKQAKADGHKKPEIVQGILLQESRAGAMSSYKVAGNKGDEYYGLGQLKIGAARDIMKKWPALWAKYNFHTRTDDELKAKLILNPHFNIEMTSKYLRMLELVYGYSGRELVNAYNRGPTGVKRIDNSNFHYAIGVENKLAKSKKGGNV